MDQYVGAKVASGRYTSASEVVREALRLLEEQDVVKAAQLSEFRDELDRRLSSLDRGERAAAKAVRARIDAKSRAHRPVS